jgi:hypothetical protein
MHPTIVHPKEVAAAFIHWFPSANIKGYHGVSSSCPYTYMRNQRYGQEDTKRQNWVWWCIPIIPALREAEVGVSRVQGPASAK